MPFPSREQWSAELLESRFRGLWCDVRHYESTSTFLTLSGVVIESNSVLHRIGASRFIVTPTLHSIERSGTHEERVDVKLLS